MRIESPFIKSVGEKTWRITADSKPVGSALNRYGFIHEKDNAEPFPEISALLPELSCSESSVSFKAEPDEDWTGFGDLTRTRLYHRGFKFDCWVRNVKSYIPVPFFMSTKGYAILVNSTHRVEFDICADVSDRVTWKDGGRKLDFYLFNGGSFKENIRLYCELTGKVKLPPLWSFGLWYICRTQANDYEAVNDALNFRREGIPCDVIGLEPGWMSKHYETSTEKQWHPERFPIPAWCPNGPHNFINAIKRMGFRFELWECNEYDLSYEEERRLRRSLPVSETKDCGNFHKDGEADEHFSWARPADTITKAEESWFEHHKKFIDQGADFFKQDGAYQICEHPGRLWGNGVTDEEMHNLYSILYARQMYEGMAEYGNRRPLVFTVAGWSGFQAFSGTWTGDTGGRLETLGGMLNTAMLGHCFMTNDMEVMQPEGIHFGYMLPWSQINSWTYFRMPWIQGERLLEMHKYYSRLRARLVPYIYSWAYDSTQSSYPLLVPLTLEFQHDKNCRNVLHQFLLGRDLMVSIYNHDIYFPAGLWKDFWSGKLYEGEQSLTVEWPDNRGGGLFVREGAIIPFGPLMQYRGEKPLDEIELYVFPASTESRFVFYEDDGVSFTHLDGDFAKTALSTQRTGNTITVKVGSPEGKYKVPLRKWNLKLAVQTAPSSVMNNGKPLEFSYDCGRGELTVDDVKAGDIVIGL